MKKLTKREKLILGISAIVLVATSIKLKNDVWKAEVAYRVITNKLCSGGVWIATDITSKTFKLIKVQL